MTAATTTFLAPRRTQNTTGPISPPASVAKTSGPLGKAPTCKSKSRSRARRISKSTTSSLTSSPRKPDSLRRSRLFKRGCKNERLNQTHFSYLWAAYRRGSLSHLPTFSEGLSIEEFDTKMTNEIVGLIQNQGDAEVLFAKTTHGMIPVGLMTVLYGFHHIEPHVIWFKEASARNKLECTAQFLVSMKRGSSIMIASKPENVTFFGHLCKYGILRRIGTFRDYWEGGNAVFFQSVGS